MNTPSTMPRCLPRCLPRLLLPALLCLMAVGSVPGQDYSTPPQRKPLFDKVRDWWERRKAPKAEYAHHPYEYTDGKQPVSKIDPPEWQSVAPIQYDWKERTYQFSKHLDKLNKEVDEWGTIQMAPLVLSPARYTKDSAEKYPFELDVITPAPGATAATAKPQQTAFEGLFGKVAPEGASTTFQSTQFRGAASANLAASGADAHGVLNTAKTDSGITPPESVFTTTSKVDPGAATLPITSLITQAAGGNLLKNIFVSLGKPEAALEYKDRKILYGVTTVSVNPGWRSKTDYVAHIDAQATVTYRKASREMISKIIRWKHLPFEARKVIAQANWQHLTEAEREVFKASTSAMGTHITVPDSCSGYFPPLAEHDRMNTVGKEERDGIYDEDMNARIAINVVTPLMDAQNLALGSTNARQVELAFQLSMLLGQAKAGSGSAFANWAKQQRRDTVTMSTLAVANAYSLGDSLFGFEVGNRLRGMANPEANDGKAGMVLERQTFPALLILGMHEDLAGPKLVRNDRNEPEVWMPELSISYNTRWSRQTRGFRGWFMPDKSPSESYKARNDLAQAVSTMYSPSDPLENHVNPFGTEQANLFSTKKNLARDYLVLTGNYFGSVLHTPLPAEFLVSPEDVETSLQDPKDRLVRAAELAVYPSNKVIQSNAAKASEATETLYMIITGKNLDQVNLAGITVQGDGLQNLPPKEAAKPPVLLGPTAISLWVNVSGGADGDTVPSPGQPAKVQTRPHHLQFELPITAGSPILEMMKEKSVFTQRCSYVFELPAPAAKPEKKPVLASLVREQITGSGAVADGKLKGSIDVMIKGSGFASWKQEDLEITVKPQGRGEYKKDSLNVLGDAGLFLTLNVEGEGAQAAFITFKVKSAVETYHSPAFEYTLIKK